MKKICVVTGTRSEYGLLVRLMRLIQQDEELELQVIATNMHLSPAFGLTCREIENDGFHIDRKVEMLLSADTRTATVKSLGVELLGLADAYEALRPDLIVLLGDRYEILGAASAALLMRIPVAHISGGDVTEGAYDDAIRHAISKMSHLHFTSNEEARQRVIRMGESPERVFNTGSTGIDNLRHTALMGRKELEESIGFQLGEHCLLVTYHPVTLEEGTACRQFEALLQAVDETGYRLIFTRPNSDSGGHDIIRLTDEYVAAHRDKAVCFTSLGYRRYLSALQFVDAVVGNSSSGLIEAPSFGIPTVNIGDRQKGRLRADSVLDCTPDIADIRRTLSKALSPAFRQQARQTVNPYEQPDSARQIYGHIKACRPEELIQKRFYSGEEEPRPAAEGNSIQP